MKASRTLIILSFLIGLLTAFRCAVGLLWSDEGHAFSFTTLQGQTIQMYGQGLYRLDPYFNGSILRGTDAVTLVVGVPLVMVAMLLHWRGSLRGTMLLAGLHTSFLYNAASYAFGVAHSWGGGKTPDHLTRSTLPGGRGRLFSTRTTIG